MNDPITAASESPPQASSRASPSLPAIVRIPQTTYRSIQRICEQARKRGTETHFYLLGERTPEVITILDVVRAGNPTEHAAFTRPDYDAAAEALAPYVEEGYEQIGEGHKHPDDLVGPSSGDFRTLRAIDRERFPGYLCLVATYVRRKGLALTAHSITSDGHIQEHAVKRVPDSQIQSHLFYSPLVEPERANIAILIVGLGSGGCNVALQVSKLNPPIITLVDNDRLEKRNLARHLADTRSVGKRKTAWMKRFLKQRGTTSTIKTSNREINPANRSWLARTIQEHDLVINCAGDPVTNQIISEEARRVGRTVIHAGVFPRGKGGFVFRQLGNKNVACFGCLFHLTRQTTGEDPETLDQLTRDYGFTPDELAGHIGLWIDVSMVSALHSKITLETMKRDPRLAEANLWLVDNAKLTITHYRIAQDPNCASCHPEMIGRDNAMTAPVDDKKGR